MSPKAYDQSTSGPPPPPALSASPRRWRPPALTESEREQSRLWALQQIRSSSNSGASLVHARMRDALAELDEGEFTEVELRLALAPLVTK
jgi:hypothetical protein